MQPGPLWNCVWKSRVIRGHGWTIGGGKRIACTGKGCRCQLRRRNGRRGGEDEEEGNGDGLNRWEDTVENVILGTEPNAPIAYAPVLELHQAIMIMLVGNRGRLYIYIYIVIERHGLNYPGNKKSKIIDTT